MDRRSSSRFKAPGCSPASTASLASAWLYLEVFCEPFGTLWFIYLLPIFFVVTKLARGLRVPPLAIWLVAAALEIAPIHTGWTVIDEFAGRFVYFYTGYMLAPRIFALAAQRAGAARRRRWPGSRSGASSTALLVFSGFADLPFVSLALGLAGAAAVVAVSALLAQDRSVRAAALLRARTRSSSISRSSCRWRRAARCCSRPA